MQTTYGGADGPMSQSVKNATTEVRIGFVRKVYGILAAQLALTVVIAYPLAVMSPKEAVSRQPILIAASLVLVMTMCAMCCCADMLRKFPTNYIFLLVLTSAMGVIVGFTSAMYTPQSVILAAGVTFVIFICMTIYAWTSKTDFTGMGPYLFAALLVLCVFGFVISIMSMFMPGKIDWLIMLYDIIGVMLFTFYIVYDTQLILGEWGGHKCQFGIDDYCFAALNLYLDIINLFLHVLSLLGERRR
jgi:hypothetical protein